MSLLDQIYNDLQGNMALTAMVGDKITPNFIYQDTPAPFVVFTVNSATRDSTLDAVGPARVEFMVDCYHTTLSLLLDLVATVKDALAYKKYYLVSENSAEIVDESQMLHQTVTFYVFDLT